MKQLFLVTLLLCFTATVFGQMTKASDSDSEATAILDKIRKKYEGFSSMQADFTLTIQIPEQKPEVQNGKIVQQGNKYRLNLQGQTVVSNGETMWLYLESLNEVQVTDADFGAEQGILSPQDLLTIYEKDEFVYALTNQFAKDGKLIQQIEFKPLKDNAEYTKLRLSTDKRTNEIVSIEVFATDGSRYTLEIDNLVANKNFPASTFTFDESQYPDVYVEDLRG